MSKKIKVVDFFSGCGGTSSGFQAAGMEIILGLDFDTSAAQTFQLNFPKAKFVLSDIASVPTDQLPIHIDRNHEFLLFSGCAPCQPFSQQNRQKEKNDPRRNLLLEFGRFVKYWQPDFVFVENVPGLQKVKSDNGPFATFCTLLSDLGYQFDFKIFSSTVFGVPQKRERLMLMASRHNSIKFPDFSVKKLPTVRDWIGDLPKIAAGETHPIDPEHQAAKLSEINLKRLKATPEGGNRKNWPAYLWLECHKNYSGHSDVYGRLWWDKPAATLTTKCISYSNGRYGHPEQDRAITIREAACLQTFPKDYKFSGSLGSKARQIGNAVPPLIAKKVGAIFLNQIRNMES